MRWIWIDKFLEFNSGKSAVSLKNVTLAEEHLHDHFPGFPIMPECLMIEAMAQTAGILCGEARKFQEKVILAKIRKAVFYHFVRPGEDCKVGSGSETGQVDSYCCAWPVMGTKATGATFFWTTFPSLSFEMTSNF